MRNALETYDITLSIEVPEIVITTGKDELSGLELAKIVPFVDRVYAAAAPENAETLAAAVKAASESVEFVPEMAAGSAAPTGSVLFFES